MVQDLTDGDHGAANEDLEPDRTRHTAEIVERGRRVIQLGDRRISGDWDFAIDSQLALANEIEKDVAIVRIGAQDLVGDAINETELPRSGESCV
ncbi:hypothetical protein [Promicromonospora sp. NPDC057488]|uniref:hypothetical protein n=1 Tax=Promicromonospora sp. NPDC057488 TaxID=3346147 RepID=UPI00366D8406